MAAPKESEAVVFFLDANVLIDAINPTSHAHQDCVELFNRISTDNIKAFTSALSIAFYAYVFNRYSRKAE